MRWTMAWLFTLLTLTPTGCGERSDLTPAGTATSSAGDVEVRPGLAATDELLSSRLEGAERVVVATVERVAAAFGRNELGDELIVSTVTVRVHETLRGEAQATLAFALEGGTVGDLTLEVSDLPSLVPGERGVFALRRSRGGTGLVPHRRALGILLLDAQGRIPAVGTLDEVRRAVGESQ
jgi:hypothetical protein